MRRIKLNRQNHTQQQSQSQSQSQPSTPSDLNTPLTTPSVSQSSSPALFEMDELSNGVVFKNSSKTAIKTALGVNFLSKSQDTESAYIVNDRVTDLTLLPNEISRYTLTLDTQNDNKLLNFFYSIVSRDQSVITSHIEIIEGSIIQILITNLSDITVSFSINYIAIY